MLRVSFIFKCNESVRVRSSVRTQNAEQYQVLSTVNPVCVLKKNLEIKKKVISHLGPTEIGMGTR